MKHIGPALVLLALTGPSLAQDLPFAAFDRASEPILSDPHDLALGPDGRIFVADKFANRITVLDADTLEQVWSFGDGQLGGAHDISFGPDGTAYVAVTGGSRVDAFRLDGDEATLLYQLNGLSRTEGVLAHSNGRVYAMASGTGQIVGFEGEEAVVAGGTLPGAHDVAEALDGSIWIADTRGRRLVNVDEELNLIRMIDAARFGFAGPRYLDVDDFGRLVVADQDAHRILLIDPDGPDGGTLLGVLGDGRPGNGPGKFDDPEGALAVGTRYYFSDSDNNRIVRYSVVTN